MEPKEVVMARMKERERTLTVPSGERRNEKRGGVGQSGGRVKGLPGGKAWEGTTPTVHRASTMQPP